MATTLSEIKPIMFTGEGNQGKSNYSDLLDTIPQFKIALAGAGGVGKSTLLKRHLTGEFEKKYVATLGVQVHPLLFYTNYGPVKLNIWDMAGQDKFGGLRDGYFIEADGTILMFDVTSKLSYKEIPYWHKLVERVAPGLPTVICGNKCDVKEQKVKLRDITIHHKLEAETEIPTSYYYTSAKSCHNFEEPFLWLARQLLGKPDLRFTEAPAPTTTDPSTIPLDEDYMTSAL